MSEDEQKRWVYHANNKSRRFPGVISYAYFLLEKSDFNQLGKMMKDGIGRDDSLLGATEGSANSANFHRKKRQEKSSPSNHKNDGAISLASAITASVKYEVRSSLLQFTYLHGDPAEKQLAKKRIEALMKDGDTDHIDVKKDQQKRSSDSLNDTRPKKIQRTQGYKFSFHFIFIYCVSLLKPLINLFTSQLFAGRKWII